MLMSVQVLSRPGVWGTCALSSGGWWRFPFSLSLLSFSSLSLLSLTHLSLSSPLSLTSLSLSSLAQFLSVTHTVSLRHTHTHTGSEAHDMGQNGSAHTHKH